MAIITRLPFYCLFHVQQLIHCRTSVAAETCLQSCCLVVTNRYGCCILAMKVHSGSCLPVLSRNVGWGEWAVIPTVRTWGLGSPVVQTLNSKVSIMFYKGNPSREFSFLKIATPTQTGKYQNQISKAFAYFYPQRYRKLKVVSWWLMCGLQVHHNAKEI
jgi:hypothetical protein